MYDALSCRGRKDRGVVKAMGILTISCRAVPALAAVVSYGGWWARTSYPSTVKEANTGSREKVISGGEEGMGERK